MRGTPYNKIVNRYWRMVMWNKVEHVEDTMAWRVYQRQIRLGKYEDNRS